MGPAELAGVLDAISDGIYVVDTNRHISFWNKGATRISGFGADEVTGRWCGDGLLNHVDDAGAALCGDRCPLLETMADGRRRECRVNLHHKDGHLVPVRVSASPLYDEAGTLTGAVELFVEDHARVQASRELAAMAEKAMLDPMTGLGNRAYLDQVLADRVAELASGGRRFGVIFVDVDRFKSVNDTHGHAVGDEALRVLATTLDRARRPEDVVTRYGGEEFVVVSGPVDGAGLMALAERLRALCGQSRIVAADASLSVTVSIGAVLARPGESAATTLDRADRRLLEAKRAGRDRVVGPPTACDA